jgi:phosphatidylinositol alpha-mannosyltransferase
LADATDPTTARSRRIALVCPYSLSRPGGVQGQVLGLARALGSRGHQVTAFAPVDDRADVPTGVDVVATGRSVSLPANGSIAPVTLSVPAVVRATRTIRSAGFDIVHVHEPFTPGLPYGLLAGRNRSPLVATFHRSGRSPFYTALRPLTRRLARRYTVRCAVSEAARSTAFDALGGSYEVGFNGVEVDHFQGVDPWPTDRPAVLFLGRHEERKGLSVLLEAFERVGVSTKEGGAGPTAARPVLWIAGDGPRTDGLRRLHPASADVHWLGVLSDQEKIRRLVAADLLCAPSLGGESFGMVLLEAMAARTVVVASDIDGYREASGGHAVLVPPGEARSLAEAMSDVLGGSAAPIPGDGAGLPSRLDDARSGWLDAAAEWAAHWSMDRLAAWYEEIYQSAMVEAWR